MAGRQVQLVDVGRQVAQRRAVDPDGMGGDVAAQDDAPTVARVREHAGPHPHGCRFAGTPQRVAGHHDGRLAAHQAHQRAREGSEGQQPEQALVGPDKVLIDPQPVGQRAHAPEHLGLQGRGLGSEDALLNAVPVDCVFRHAEHLGLRGVVPAHLITAPVAIPAQAGRHIADPGLFEQAALPVLHHGLGSPEFLAVQQMVPVGQQALEFLGPREDGVGRDIEMHQPIDRMDVAQQDRALHRPVGPALQQAQRHQGGSHHPRLGHRGPGRILERLAVPVAQASLIAAILPFAGLELLNFHHHLARRRGRGHDRLDGPALGEGRARPQEFPRAALAPIGSLHPDRLAGPRALDPIGVGLDHLGVIVRVALTERLHRLRTVGAEFQDPQGGEPERFAHGSRVVAAPTHGLAVLEYLSRADGVALQHLHQHRLVNLEALGHHGQGVGRRRAGHGRQMVLQPDHGHRLGRLGVHHLDHARLRQGRLVVLGAGRPQEAGRIDRQRGVEPQAGLYQPIPQAVGQRQPVVQLQILIEGPVDVQAASGRDDPGVGKVQGCHDLAERLQGRRARRVNGPVLGHGRFIPDGRLRRIQALVKDRLLLRLQRVDIDEQVPKGPDVVLAPSAAPVSERGGGEIDVGTTLSLLPTPGQGRFDGVEMGCAVGSLPVLVLRWARENVRSLRGQDRS